MIQLKVLEIAQAKNRREEIVWLENQRIVIDCAA